MNSLRIYADTLDVTGAKVSPAVKNMQISALQAKSCKYLDTMATICLPLFT